MSFSTRPALLVVFFACALPVYAAEQGGSSGDEPTTDPEAYDEQEREPTPGDPWEGLNRGVHTFNDKMDGAILRPVAVANRKIFPAPIRRALGRMFRNMREPMVIVNQLLQGKPKLAIQDTGRLLLNSTVGLGGAFDVASKAGLEAHEEDFGQTFAKWGIGPGPYFVSPFFGPRTVRDAFGGLFGFAMWPMNFVPNRYWRYGTTVADVITTRTELLEAESLVSGDPYVFFRDAYLTRRDYLIHDGIVDDPFLDDF